MTGTIEINNFPYNAERIKYSTDGVDFPDITINGTGFGLPPNIVLYRDWSRDALGAMSLTNNMVGNNFQLDQGIVPTIYNTFGKNGVAHREGGTDAATTNRRTTFFTTLPVHKNFRVGFDLATPAGRTFSGAVVAGTIPSESVLKNVWMFDQPADSGTKADVVVGSWTSDGFRLVGNNCPYNVYGTSQYDFTGWNYYQGAQVCGADPFADSGTETFTCSNALINTVTATQSNVPSFGSGADTAQYDRVYINAWSGNGINHDLSLHLISYIYVAMADNNNVNQRIELMNNSVYASASKVRLIPYKSWSDTEIIFSKMDHYIDQGFTHYRVTAGSNTITGAL